MTVCLLAFEMIWLQESAFSWVDWTLLILASVYSIISSVIEFRMSSDDKSGDCYILRVCNALVLAYVVYKSMSLPVDHDTANILLFGAVSTGLFNVLNFEYYVSTLWLIISGATLLGCNLGMMTTIILAVCILVLFGFIIYFSYSVKKDRNEWRVSSGVWHKRYANLKVDYSTLKTDYSTLEDMYIDKAKSESKWWKFWE